MTVVTSTTLAGNQDVDGSLSGYKWADTNLTFSFPTDGSFYNFGYISGAGAPTIGFAPLTVAEQQAALLAFRQYAAVSNLRFTQITETANQHADLREAQSGQPHTAMTFAPDSQFNIYHESADSWYNNGGTQWGILIGNPLQGGYGFHAFLHEIGLALGMRDDGLGTNLPEPHDSMEYSIESYRSYVDAPVTNGLLNETWGYAQSLMMDDIAAIQQMYGANFSAVGETVAYSWDPHTGEEFINGVGQGAPGGDKIFMTVWDQGATATYDLSNYTTDLKIDLRPGQWSTFDPAQLADLGANAAPGLHLAAGNVANALEYGNDPRSLIHAVIGGSGHNTIIGNDAGDYLYGGTGGHNTLLGGAGNDVIDGGPGSDNTAIYTGMRSDYQITELQNDWLELTDLRPGSPNGTDQVTNIQHFQFSDGVYDWEQSAPQFHTAASATADVILQRTVDGVYTMYDIGSNAVLASYELGHAGPEWHFVGLGGFSGNDTTDMLLRDGNTGAFEVYDIDNNHINSAASMGQAGLEWQLGGFGDFSSQPGETDMILRNVNTGGLEVYDISNNQIVNAAFLGQVGMELQIAGFGNFSSNPGETDMIMRNINTGAFEFYDIANNHITGAGSMGQVGLEWQVAGFGNFSGHPGEADMLMRNSSTGALQFYDIANNQISSAGPADQVGLSWQVAGFGDFSGHPGETDMLMHNISTGAFEFYDITNNQIIDAGPMAQIGQTVGIHDLLF